MRTLPSGYHDPDVGGVQVLATSVAPRQVISSDENRMSGGHTDKTGFTHRDRWDSTLSWAILFDKTWIEVEALQLHIDRWSTACLFLYDFSIRNLRPDSYIINKHQSLKATCYYWGHTITVFWRVLGCCGRQCVQKAAENTRLTSNDLDGSQSLQIWSFATLYRVNLFQPESHTDYNHLCRVRPLAGSAGRYGGLSRLICSTNSISPVLEEMFWGAVFLRARLLGIRLPRDDFELCYSAN